MAIARDLPAPARVPDLGDAPPGSAHERALAALWESAPGWRGWLGTVDHKRIGLRYIVTAFAFLLLGGVEALVMRIQLARPNATLLTPAQYDALFTMHGVTMIFLYALPVLSGFANYLWPLMLGSRDMAFPRLNAFSYWAFLFAGLFLYASFPLGAVPDGGWFNYVPLTSLDYSAGANIDIYALGMILLGISTTGGAANFVVTLLRMRAHGMSIDRLPIIVWGTLTASVANLVAVPSVSLAFLLLWLDRNAGTHFFDVAHDGRPLLWQHLFWMFAHPWVYVVVLPAMGIVSDALPAFCRRPLVAYEAVAVSTVATMLIGFEVWVHHMFATGIAPLALAFFGAASMLISIPSAVAVFAWIATIWTGRPVFRTPFLYFAGFVLMFVIGGVSGVMTAAVPLDWQLTDTYFVVAHLHYVLLGINVFPVLGGITYWFPKFTGRMMNERFGRWTFWVVLTGFNVGFFPMHVSGLLGMPRRIYTYPPGMGWDTSNLLTTIGSFIFGIGIVMFVVNALVSARRGARAGANPWRAAGLEWSVASPAPVYNFAVLPLVASRHPLWETRDDARRTSVRVGYRLADGREALAVTPLAATPDAILKMPDDTCLPFVLALLATAVFAAMLVRSPALVGAAVAGCAIATAAWLWPRRTLWQRDEPPRREPAPAPPAAVSRPDEPLPAPVPHDAPAACLAPLPVGSCGERAGGWWGVITLVVTEAGLFGYLLFAYFYLQSQSAASWPPEGMPKIGLAAVNTVVLLSSSGFVWLAERAVRAGRRPRAVAALAVALALGTAFAFVQLHEWRDHPYGPTAHLYGSLYFTITGFHLAHVVAGLAILALLAGWTAAGFFGRERRVALTVGALYWHFVDVVWLFIFTALYVSPYWLRRPG
ncbi:MULTISPECIES: cytochrome c oxidase subunit I [Burkholderia]|uniref:cytochrome-c oxidase n=1 Tax=Burkholderia contaminans TaxID=488447 RepID=A0A2S5DR12_9BURK|nr:MULTISPECIES: cytochrome c oxidase subunit I [Burkholderia]EKS9797953.1 cytochrome c oxidase subunit I [Burkholderia cepacia]EKS9805015.1 cytochrome c oxidase subunit I [Burkholderia cepacia]EKS9822738.1 cytochrome c oxidase subunit I [Burkholderia cepacia]EKS9830255.1 cytochrome c oxidase subunit I [Burkholderia cepacia]EKS9851379.1 cytochrome c oxidase subunit I [Burkholderia cepacia]